MESLTHRDYQRQTILNILNEHYQIAQKNRDCTLTETFILTDLATDNYILLASEQKNQHRVYGVLLHLRLAEGKILIETNNIADVIEDLIDRGIPATDFIVPVAPINPHVITVMAGGHPS